MDSKSVGTSDADRSEKLAAARKKLQQYQRRREVSSEGRSRTSLSQKNGDEEQRSDSVPIAASQPSLTSHGSFIHDEERSPFQTKQPLQRVASRSNSLHAAVLDATAVTQASETTQNVPPTENVSDTLSRPHAASTSGSDSTPKVVDAYTERLKESERQLAEQRSANELLMKQMEQLHGLYTQLYNAYNQLNESQGGGDTVTLQQQLQQHMQTIGVLVEEKSALQSQLRQAMALANEKHALSEQLEGRLDASRARIDELEKSVDTLKSTNTQMEHTMQRQRQELEKRRAEATANETHAINMQQDKAELQARLKVRAREVEKLQAEVGDLRKDVHMKEIYIRQLSAHAAGVSRLDELDTKLNEAQARLDATQKERDMLKADLEHTKQKLQVTVQQLQQQLHEVQQRCSVTSQELLQERQALADVKARLHAAQEYIEMMRDTAGEANQREAHETAAQATLSEQSSIPQAPSVDVDQEWERALHVANERIAALTEQRQAEVEETATVEKLRAELADRDERIALMQQTLDARPGDNVTQKLLEQIHNERATVSRAVAQNRQLKEQQIELEDKIVALSNQNAELATKVATYEHQVKNAGVNDTQALKEQIEKLEKDLAIARQEKEDDEDDYADDRDALKSQITSLENNVRALETELNTSQVQLHRAMAENDELHRIMHQNAHDENQNSIHVELQQALDRATHLSQENRLLRQQLEERNETLSESSTREQSRRSIDVAQQNGHENSVAENNNDETTPSEHDSTKLHDLHSTLELLQKRFIRAMNENAEMSVKQEQLEHLVEQLQTETDTVGEYITIYLHQRRVMNERLKERDEKIAQLTQKHLRTQDKLNELQRLVVRVMQEQHAIVPYPLSTPKHGKPKAQHDDATVELRIGENGTLEAPLSRQSNASPIDERQRSLSISEVDEVEHHEHLIVDHGVAVGDTLNESAAPSPAHSVNDLSEYARFNQSSTTAQIIQLLNELRESSPQRTFSPSGDFVHCKECRGKLTVV